MEEICGTIFVRPKDRSTCEELPLSLAVKIDITYDILLNSPSEESLNALSLHGLDILLDISPRPLEKALGRMRNRTKRRFVTYLAGKPEVVDIIQEVDDWHEYEILVSLFEFKPYGNKSSNALTPLVKKTLQWEQEAMRDNHEVWEWIDGFVKRRFCSKFPIDKSLCVLTNLYCQLSLTKEEEEALMQTDQLESVLDEVLKEHRPQEAPNWWTRRVTAWDLSSYKSEPHNVCALLLPKAHD